MEYGIATKLSKINNDYSKLLELNKISSSNFDYHVIDAELLPLTDENILNNLKNCVLTIQSKRKNAFELLDLYSSYDFDICVVLGNNFYLSEEESKLKREIILKVINKALDRCSNKIWVGTECVEGIVKDIVEENDLIAYYVYGGKYPTADSKKAVYIPYAEKIDKNVLNAMENYLNRRKNYAGNYNDFILSLDNYAKIKELKNKNDDIIIGYPINNKIINFKKII
ncbi:hypothetical protein [Methanothermococcus sp.]|uniref:hypothetical protein n=1 Tax=Methanothermococcus sp. TaxID=2614238 RepID=UPI0025E30F33|nr:hypothetical protein [Methanothermococcus sp.]